MEFAVSAIFILVLLLPGFILQSAYTKGLWRWNSPTSARTLTEQIPAAVVLASVLHVLWATLAAGIGYPVNLNAVAMLLLGSYGHDEIHFDTTVRALTSNPYKVFAYFASLNCVAALVGYVSHWVVREAGWDRSTRILRFNNQWFYLLSGEITEFKEAPEDFPEIDGVLLTTVVHHNETDWLYIGVIADFFFDKSGQLDRVLLRLVDRRKLSDDQTPGEEVESDDKYYHIEGDYFVLRYSEMCTINIDYIFVTPESDLEPDDAAVLDVN